MTFGAPTTETDASVTIDDTLTCPEGFHGRNAEVVTQYLPIALGSGGGKTVVVETAEEAVNVLSFGLGHSSNGITKLYARVKLNIANGASADGILGDINQADAFLALKQPDKKKVLNWMSTFDGYNNGDLGPGHCD